MTRNLSKEVRRHRRTQMQARFRVMFRDGFGRERVGSARAVDISQTGVKLLLPERVNQKDVVQIESMPHKLNGAAQVRYCARAGMDYVIGLEFCAGMQYSGAVPQNSSN